MVVKRENFCQQQEHCRFPFFGVISLLKVSPQLSEWIPSLFPPSLSPCVYILHSGFVSMGSRLLLSLLRLNVSFSLSSAQKGGWDSWATGCLMELLKGERCISKQILFFATINCQSNSRRQMSRIAFSSLLFFK